ncbi:MAG: ATP-binding protein [Lactobacillus sp.]|jgi:AAA+ ATPase superfamily predicted ATPase|nr:ATP-binding protein [Lactobacillus sp.]MCH3906208.1 ATP-binding protein [Lactobacillus sp.]MCH3990213.1 ATP-binding protein [Lactobacillus sp.]MCH4069073.1 ATP-binding protein [Lactobacillus sp.]MCI1303940.1 ATP-binding protein [Lactobacillus sp.]
MLQNYPFVARKRELQRLNKMYESPTFQMAVIYGRRRVGKTSLIREFIKDKPAIYSQGIQTVAKQNLALFADDISAFIKDTSLIPSPASYANYRDAFTYIETVAGQLKQKLILVLDEYPYFAESDPAISSELQTVIDHLYKQKNNIMLILCGSSMSFMEHQVLGEKSPLYGRRTAQLKINPFTIFETKEMLTRVSNTDLLAYYGLTGGIPQYLAGIDQKLSFSQNLEELFLYPDSFLFNEPNILLEQEFNNPTLYFAILSAIAKGKTRFNEIFEDTDLKNSSNLVPRLNNLLELGIIEQKIPIFSKSTRKGIYVIKDNLFRFWFRFIATQQSAINSGRIAGLEKRILTQLADFLGPTFEQVSKEWLWQADDLPLEPRTIDNWWGNNPIRKRQEEIDLVAPNYNDTEAIIGECKWRNSANLNHQMIDLLQERALLLPKISKRYLFFFAKDASRDFITYAHSRGVRVILYNNFFS